MTRRTDLDLRALFRLMDRQAGVVSRAQLHALGGTQNDIDRLTRRRQLARFSAHVLIAPTDAPTWQQRAWAGVLHHWPAALAGHSALRATAGPGWRRHDDAAPITVMIDSERMVRRPLPGYDVRTSAHLDERADWAAEPPRLRPEEVALDLAAATDDGLWAGIDALAMVIDWRGVSPAVLREAADRRARIRNAGWLRPLLRDLDRGRPLTLERLLHERVEEPHGLPRARRRRPRTAKPDDRHLRPMVYAPHRVSVLLDGQVRHDSTGRRDRELEERLDHAVALGHDRRVRLTFGWGQVVAHECATAARLAALLRRRGWDGTPHPCDRPDCPVGAVP